MLRTIYVIVLAVTLIRCSQSPSTNPTTSVGDSTGRRVVSDIVEQVKHSRAVETVIWGIPIVNSDRMFQAMAKAGGKFNQIVYWSGPSDWKNQVLTPNGDAIYFMPFINTKDVGPVVLELPPAEGGSIVGSVMDYWQMPIEDVGTAGVDKGKGGKYLILPPDYKEKLPAGYIPMRSFTYQVYALLRSIPKSTDEVNTKQAVDYGKRIRIYPYSERSKVPETVFVDVRGQLFDATIPYDLSFFESLNSMIQMENWLVRDKVMINSLKSIGIEKGKPFSPDSKLKGTLESAAKDAQQWLAHFYLNNFEPFYTTAHWFLPADKTLLGEVGNAFSSSDEYPIDPRGCAYYAAFSGIKHMGAGQFYLFSAKDKDGNPLEGSKSYKLHVPADVPIKQYWSVTLYDFDTHAFIREVDYPSRSSLNPAIQKNADGSVDIYMSPTAPAGKEGNWLPTRSGGRFEALFRLYGPNEDFFKKQWQLPDVEEVK